jgi:hypothetical protein
VSVYRAKFFDCLPGAVGHNRHNLICCETM